MGGAVTFQDGWRVNNAISVSRAIGDPEYKQWICSDADVCSVPFNGGEDFLVAACDGLWDSLSPADVTAVVYHQLLQQNDDLEDVASHLVHHSKDQGSSDNISAIVVFLRSPDSLIRQATVVPHLEEELKKQNGIDHLERNGIRDFVESAENNFPASSHFEESLGNPFGGFSQEQYAPMAGNVPEKTAFSELPTPPIEDMLPSEEFSIRSDPETVAGNPFTTSASQSHDTLSFLDETAQFVVESPLQSPETNTNEMASDIVNTAIETALEICSENSVPELVTPPDVQSRDNLLLADQKEVNVASMMEVVDVDAFNSGRDFVREEPDAFNLEQNTVFGKPDDFISNMDVVRQEVVKKPQAFDLGRDVVEDKPDVFKSGMDAVKEEEEINLNPFNLGMDAVGEEPGMVPDVFDLGRDTVQMSQEMRQNVVFDGNYEARTEERPLTMDVLEDRFEYHIPLNTAADDQMALNDPFAQFRETHHDFSSSQGDSQNAPGDETDYLNSTGQFEIQSSIEADSKMLQENPFLSGPDSLLLYGNLAMNVETNEDLFSLTGEAPSAVRLLQGVPEMLGISESVPGSKTPEMVSVGMPSDTMEKLAATVDNLTRCMDDLTLETNSHFEAKAFDSVLETVPMLEEKVSVQHEKEPLFALTPEGNSTQEIVADVPKVKEQFSFLEEVKKAPEEQIEVLQLDVTQTFKQEVAAPADPVPQANILHLEQSLPTVITEIAKTGTEEVPTPAVVVESIPESVPEAEGVTEDSDSEKDGGWKYISSEKQPKADASKTKPAAPTAAEAHPNDKGTRETDTVKRAKPSPASTAPRKPAANKVGTETKTPTVQKKPSPTQSTLKKVSPSIDKTSMQSQSTNPPRPSAPLSRTLKQKTTAKAATLTRPSTAPSEATKPATGSAGISKLGTAKPTSTTVGNSKPPSTTVGTAKPSSTMQRPSSTIIRKSKSPGTTPETAVSSATSTLRPTATKPTTQRPTTSTLPHARTAPRKPLVNGDSAAPKPAAPEKKPVATGTMKPQKPVASRIQQKETKDTVNKELSKMPEKPKSAPSTATTRKLPVNGLKETTLQRTAPPKPAPARSQVSTIRNSKPSPLKNNRPTAATTAAKTAQKITTAKVSPMQKASENKQGKEKGSLDEENTKETKPVDSGLASPESPLIPQLEIPKEGEAAGTDPVQMIQQ